jgi:hypothetical protein
LVRGTFSSFSMGFSFTFFITSTGLSTACCAMLVQKSASALTAEVLSAEGG